MFTRKYPLKNLLTSLFFICGLGCRHSTDWRTADNSSSKIAPLPQDEPRAVIQIYAARVFGWRGYFSVHSWLAYKEKDSDHYVTYHVIGWKLNRGLNIVTIEKDIPDRKWYGSSPDLILDLRGQAAEKAIPKIQAVASTYPYPYHYRAYPGPNSNTFVSYIIRHVPELEIELPPNAIGKDWINKGDLIGMSESGTGVQFSVYGLLGATAGLGEGVEVNLLGMSFGVDILRPALKLPFIGRIGLPDKSVFIKSDE